MWNGTSRVAGSKIRSAWRAGAHGAGGSSFGDGLEVDPDSQRGPNPSVFARPRAVSSRPGGVVGAHASWRTPALKGQACSRKSGDLFDRSAMSSLQVDSAVVSAFCPTRTFVLFSSFVGVEQFVWCARCGWRGFMRVYAWCCHA